MLGRKESEGKIAILLGSDGNEMQVGGKLRNKLERLPLQGVLFRIAHPKAVAADERYLGTGSDAQAIMGRYPGKLFGDPEQRAARRNLRWVRRHKPKIVVDIHETTISGSYFAIGETTTQAAIVGAYELGYTKCLVEDASFYRLVPNSVALEVSLADANVEQTTEQLYRDLSKVASRSSSLQDRYQEVVPNITFFQKFALNSDRLKNIGWLKQLEAIPKGSKFSELKLPPEFIEELGLPPGTSVFYDSWGHDNMSKQLPERLGYAAPDTPRREYFGSLLVQIVPPIPTADGYVFFEKEQHDSLHNPNGLLKLA